jgi:hypothetical protein
MVFAVERYASEIDVFAFGRGFPDANFTQQLAKKAFSPVNEQAVLDDRLFQQNRPISTFRDRQKSANTHQGKVPGRTQLLTGFNWRTCVGEHPIILTAEALAGLRPW